MKILVIGGTRFFGIHMVKELLEKGHDVTFASDSDFISAKYYMKAYLEGEDPNVWDAIWKFQDEVLDRRLKAKHKKETYKIDKKMEMVPEKPEGFEKWVHEIVRIYPMCNTSVTTVSLTICVRGWV